MRRVKAGKPPRSPEAQGTALADIAQFRIASYIGGMAETLNISLAPGQLAWLKARKQEEGFATASDVVRDLIRRLQETERAALSAEFDKLKGDGAAGPEPVHEITKIVRKVKKERREINRRA
jgi:Arc/MetJ-type ribon-helix-helix transcriptional regulator